MATDTFVRNVIVAALATAFGLAGPSARADAGALERFLGSWDVRRYRHAVMRAMAATGNFHRWVRAVAPLVLALVTTAISGTWIALLALFSP
jgi:hypothetical protein